MSPILSDAFAIVLVPPTILNASVLDTLASMASCIWVLAVRSNVALVLFASGTYLVAFSTVDDLFVVLIALGALRLVTLTHLAPWPSTTT